MTISNTILTVGTASAATNPTTASITPAPNTLVEINILVLDQAPGPDVPTSVTGNGITYTLVTSTADAGSGSGAFGSFKTYLYRGMSAAPTAGVITINGGPFAFIGWDIDQINMVDLGANGANAIRQSASAISAVATSSPLVTLAAFGNVVNGAYGAINQDCDTETEGSGWTEIQDINAAPNSFQRQYRVSNDTTCDWTPNRSGVYCAIAVELVPYVMLRRQLPRHGGGMREMTGGMN